MRMNAPVTTDAASSARDGVADALAPSFAGILPVVVPVLEEGVGGVVPPEEGDGAVVLPAEAEVALQEP